MILYLTIEADILYMYKTENFFNFGIGVQFQNRPIYPRVFVCSCVSLCVRAYMHACVRMCMLVCLFVYLFSDLYFYM